MDRIIQNLPKRGIFLIPAFGDLIVDEIKDLELREWSCYMESGETISIIESGKGFQG